MSQKEMNQKKIFRKTLVFGGITLAVLAIYLGVSIFYRFHFYPNTTIGAVDVSNKNVAQATELLRKRVSDYQLTLEERDDQKEIIEGKNISLVLDREEAVQETLNLQNGFTWPKALSKPIKYKEQSVSFDKEQLLQLVASLNCQIKEKQIAPEDACIQYENGSFVVRNEILGTTISADVLESKVLQAVRDMKETLDLDETGCYINPELYSDDEEFLQAVETANQYLKAGIHYEAGDRSLDLNSDIIATFLTIDEDKKVSYKEEAIDDFLVDLATAFNTYNRDKKFMTYYGKEITVSRGDYGFKVDKKQEKEDIKKTLEACTTQTREPFFSKKGAVYSTYQYGGNYVEANLTAQHLFVYRDGKMVYETDFVSGCVARETQTRLGMNRLKYKQKDAVLRGDDYETHVNYWMPFDGGIGMHDAIWRSNFGGSIYKNSGSHGCLNLPLYAAKKIYDLVEPGEAIVVYELPGTEPASVKKEQAKEKEKEKEKQSQNQE